MVDKNKVVHNLNILRNYLLEFTINKGFVIFFFKDFILFIFRKKGRKREREREISMCGCLNEPPTRDLAPQPRHVPWLGIKLVTLWFIGLCSIHWATAAWAALKILMHASWSHTQVFLLVINLGIGLLVCGVWTYLTLWDN